MLWYHIVATMNIYKCRRMHFRAVVETGRAVMLGPFFIWNIFFSLWYLHRLPNRWWWFEKWEWIINFSRVAGTHKLQIDLRCDLCRFRRLKETAFSIGNTRNCLFFIIAFVIFVFTIYKSYLGILVPIIRPDSFES